jgi:transcriptional regulator with XRE-family HTH domain
MKINTEVWMDRIRQLRKERGLSQVKLAVMADMDPATLNRLERGTGNPNLKTLERVADALGVEVADFFPKAGAPSSQGKLFNNGPEEERRRDAYEVALDAARRQAVQSRQAANRAEESDRPQTYFMRHENEAVMELLKYPAEELVGALIDTAAAREDERHDSILAKAIGVAAERWAAITTANLASPSGPDRESVPGVYLVAADLENLLSIVMGDGEVWEKLSRVERSEIATVAAALGRVTEGYHDHKDEAQAAEQRRAMVRQWTRELELATSA